MLGAIIGDIVGSRFEFNNTNRLDFELFTPECGFTDDTICTIAIANALTSGDKNYKEELHRWCNAHRFPLGGYGGSFARWVASSNPQPYNSFGNGSAMRVAAIGWWFDTLEEVQTEAKHTALPTHNHPEGIKGAVATATAIFLARKHGKKFMLTALKDFYPTWVEPQLGENPFNETCQGTLPVVLGILNKAHNFEEALRYAIAVGGDSDTIGAIVGSISEAIWGIPEEIAQEALNYLPEKMRKVITDFHYALKQPTNSETSSITTYDLNRFIEAQERDYTTALREMQNGRKVSHWIWYIFPQRKGLGHSYNSKFYALDGVDEARAYLEHPILSERLRTICRAILTHADKRDIEHIMGSQIDVIKLQSSMNLFNKVAPGDVFQQVLDAFF